MKLPFCLLALILPLFGFEVGFGGFECLERIAVVPPDEVHQNSLGLVVGGVPQRDGAGPDLRGPRRQGPGDSARGNN